MTVFFMLLYAFWKLMTYPFTPLAHFVFKKEKDEKKRKTRESVFLLICLIVGYIVFKSPDMIHTYIMENYEYSEFWMNFYKNYNLIVHLCALAYTVALVVGPIRFFFFTGNHKALTRDDIQELNEARRKNAEKDKAYWNGYWDGFIG